MAHLYLQEDPKVSVAGSNDAASSVPTPEQLGSLLVTYSATGATSQSAAAYAALEVGGTAQWVPLTGGAGGSGGVIKWFSGTFAGGVVEGTVGFLADTGLFSIKPTPVSYPVSSNGLTVSTLTVVVSNNSQTTETTVTLTKNGGLTAITVSIPAGTTGEFTATGSVSYVSGDTFDLRADSVVGSNGSNDFAAFIA